MQQKTAEAVNMTTTQYTEMRYYDVKTFTECKNGALILHRINYSKPSKDIHCIQAMS